MILKIDDELNWETFAHRAQTVKAKLITEDFMIETSMGFLNGKAGDYLVEVGKGIRFPCQGGDFLRTFRPFVERRLASERPRIERRHETTPT